MKQSKEYNPVVTIITAVYNAERYLEESMISVLEQTYPHVEYIIIDGGSSDNSVSIIKRYSDRLAYWVSEPDQGIYDAWNKGLHKANGDWIAFIGSDDILHPFAVARYVEHIQQHPQRDTLEFISSRIELVTERLAPVRVVGQSWSWPAFRKSMITWHVGCFHSHSLFSRYGFFDTSYKVCGDYELLMRPGSELKTSFLNESTVRMRLGGVSMTKLYEAAEETYRAKVTNKLLSPLAGMVMSRVDKVKIFGKRWLIRWGLASV